MRFVDRLAAATAGAADGDTNLVRTGNATRLVHALPIYHDRRKHEEAFIGDIARTGARDYGACPDLFAAFAFAARTGTLPELLADLQTQCTGGDARSRLSAEELLDPELLALGLQAADED